MISKTLYLHLWPTYFRHQMLVVPGTFVKANTISLTWNESRNNNKFAAILRMVRTVRGPINGTLHFSAAAVWWTNVENTFSISIQCAFDFGVRTYTYARNGQNNADHRCKITNKKDFFFTCEWTNVPQPVKPLVKWHYCDSIEDNFLWDFSSLDSGVKCICLSHYPLLHLIIIMRFPWLQIRYDPWVDKPYEARHCSNSMK